MKRMNLPKLSFDHFYNYEELKNHVKKFCAAAPDLAALSSLGKSREGREILMLTITDFSTGQDRDKPGYLIHGNIHASELSGVKAALFTAEKLILDHKKNDLLKHVAFYIVPRLNPDGAEFIVTTSGRTRSRYDRSNIPANTLVQKDMNSDGLILMMRQEHPDGDFALDPKNPRILIRRTKDSPPPFYRKFMEGEIHNWDGSDNINIEGRSMDWNRNWSSGWRPEPEQNGSGDFPFSEPEMRAIAEFMHDHPNLFGVLGYHNGPNAVLRPPSTCSDSDLPETDVLIMDEIARKGAEITGFPLYPVFKYHRKFMRDKNYWGHFHDFGYHHLGLYVFEIELGNLLNSAGISTAESFSVQSPLESELLYRKLMKWTDKKKFTKKIFKPWKSFKHPQLGPVEIGGLLDKYMANPTMEDLQKICKNTYRFTLEHVSYRPQLALEDLQVDKFANNIFRIRTRVANRGTFPTHITVKGKNLTRLQPVRLEFNPDNNLELISLDGHRHLGHLNGLGSSKIIEWFVAVKNKKIPGKCQIKIFGGTGGNFTKTVIIK